MMVESVLILCLNGFSTLLKKHPQVAQFHKQLMFMEDCKTLHMWDKCDRNAAPNLLCTAFSKGGFVTGSGKSVYTCRFFFCIAGQQPK